MKLWGRLLREVPQLRVYGYTARAFDDAEDPEIAREIARVKWHQVERKVADRTRPLPTTKIVTSVVRASAKVSERCGSCALITIRP